MQRTASTPSVRTSSRDMYGVQNDLVDHLINDPDRVWERLRELPGVRSWKILSDGLFLALNFVVGIITFVSLLVLFVVGVSTSVALIGIPILFVTFGIVMYLAQLERSRIRMFTGVNIPSPYQHIPSNVGFWKRSWIVMRSAALWRDTVYLFLLFPIGILSLMLVSIPFSFIVTPFITLFGGENWIVMWQINSFGESVFAVIVGAILLYPMSIAINLAVLLQVRVAERFLGSSVEEILTERVEELTESRSAVMRAMHLERRRIERDLHDGAQQRLVSLAMELGLAKEKLESDPEGARKLIEESHEDAKLVLQELRELVRGIHPAVLTDRGLDAAISAVAGRCPVPVTVDVQLTGRLPEEVEGSAYFVVVEALTNIARHSKAEHAGVSIRRRGNWLKVVIEDDGIGGARMENGSGLRGLRDRIHALDGIFHMESPVGTGTTIEVDIPCGL